MPEENVNQNTNQNTNTNTTPNEPQRYTSDEWTAQFNKGGWMQTLPEDLTKEASLGKFVGKPPAEVVKSYVQLQKAFGDRVPKPKSEFTKAEWDDWNKNYNPGYPQSPEQYELPMPQDEKFVKQVDPEALKRFKERAYKHGLTVEQAKRLWTEGISEEYNVYKGNLERANTKIKEDQTALKKEWGARYDDNIRLARTVINKFASPELVEQLKGSYISSHVWKMLAEVGKNFKEGTIETGGKPSGALTPKEATIKAHEIIEKEKDAYFNKLHPKHQAVVKEVNKYFRMANVR
jgi:hypothetical protein